MYAEILMSGNVLPVALTIAHDLENSKEEIKSALLQLPSRLRL
jgi:hypothetical protein